MEHFVLVGTSQRELVPPLFVCKGATSYVAADLG
jgi:hypothetical protein